MKLTLSRFFDMALISSSNAYKSLQSFFEYQAQLNDNLFRILLNNVSIKDNLDANLITVPLIQNLTSQIKTIRRPIAVYVASQDTFTKPLNSFVWYMDSDNQLSVTITCLDTSYTLPINVTLVIHYS